MEYITKTSNYLYKFESRFDEKKVIPWMVANWHWSIVISAIYLVLVLGGQQFMKKRAPLDLRRVLCMWSSAHCVFSFYALCRVAPYFYYLLVTGGIRHSMCDSMGYIGSMGGGVWCFLFPFSKLPELFDTAFIVLRKKRLSFLHTYHHISVFVYCWYSYAHPIGTGIWFGLINYSVHTIMYAYYAYTASGRVVSRRVAKCITILQLSQMFVGVYINYVGITSLLRDKACATNWFAISISIFFYVSYAILFGNFFYQAYIIKKPRPSRTFISKSKENVVNGVTALSSSTILNGSQFHSVNGLCYHNKKL